MAIEPDTKDWTWVITRPCEECGFDASAFDVTTVGDLIRENAAQWQEILALPEADLVARPTPDRWSALEYACHVRDVFHLFDERLALMLDEDDPHFANWDQDVTAVEQRYGEQDPGEVAVDIAAGAEALASRFDAVAGDQWQRTGNRSDGARFTVDSFARYLIHDPVHHVDDVRKGFEAMAQPEIG